MQLSLEVTISQRGHNPDSSSKSDVIIKEPKRFRNFGSIGLIIIHGMNSLALKGRCFVVIYYKQFMALFGNSTGGTDKCLI